MLRSLPFMPGPELYDLFRAVGESQKSIDHQIDEAMEALKRSSSLITDLEEQLKSRTAKLEALQKEHERLSKLSEITEEQAKAVADQLSLTIGKSQRGALLKGILINLFIGLIIFVVGVFAAEPLRDLVSSLGSAAATS